MMPGIHRCRELELAEQRAKELEDCVIAIPSATRTLSLTRVTTSESAGRDWILQLCGTHGELTVLVHFCPFCGVHLFDACALALRRASASCSWCGTTHGQHHPNCRAAKVTALRAQARQVVDAITSLGAAVAIAREHNMALSQFLRLVRSAWNAHDEERGKPS